MTIDVDHAWLMSDLHLDAGRPELTGILFRFLRGAARRAQALFLLGDVFEAWIGDDDDAPLPAAVAAELRAVAEAGTTVYFLHGNRDFLLGAAYARRAGLTLLPDPTHLRLGGVPTVLCHGDALCLDDRAYQRWRAQARDPAWQAQLLARPLAERRALARQLRAESREAQRRLRERGLPWADADPAAVLALLQRQGAARLIHGHTHRPAEHEVRLPGGRRAERWVLADWGEAGEALEITPDGAGRRHRL
ncbi:UDP-2,3-diacylglucosamine diphosphatase [Fulvimonas yonginensis]|uniref:UDP-2,3-diacylglucosamine hydrolase n=1 Tax=Fulvimonas yonginensis TaxID=1495200 RepID=A0ABU8JCC5_9GAMM